MKRNVYYAIDTNLIEQANLNPAVKNRASIIHNLITSYGLLEHMRCFTPKSANLSDLRSFHSRDFIENYVPNLESVADKLNIPNTKFYNKYGLTWDDCPIWENINNYVCTIAGATMSCCDILCKLEAKALALKNVNIHAKILNENDATRSHVKQQNIVINWTGGWHHAQRSKASGFCYINDIVLGIYVLRKQFKRILYIDLDIHHGDGVQNAFARSKSVFTLSFHKYETCFFPGSGSVKECGLDAAKGYSANFPYCSGINGKKFQNFFKRIAGQIFDRFKPNCCIIQNGADVIVGDPKGKPTNLTPKDLITCVDLVLQRNLPTILLGGGGYNFPNTSRYWTQLTAHVCDKKIDDDIPAACNDFMLYGPDFTLDIPADTILRDENTDEYLEAMAKIIEEQLELYNVSDD